MSEAAAAFGITACQWLLEQLAVWGNVLVEATAEEHDRMMGIVQALRHQDDIYDVW